MAAIHSPNRFECVDLIPLSMIANTPERPPTAPLPSKSSTKEISQKTFKKLISEEEEQLRGATASSSDLGELVVAEPGSAEEPWVAFNSHNRVGLALSGGGIRSATFNLGLIQALRHQGILKHIDYLSTVSGGGYTGGFWTAWRQKSAEMDEEGKPMLFPVQKQSNTGETPNRSPGVKEIRERAEIRHLREFSRFLMPRVGFRDAETWNGIIAAIFGLLPSLLVTFSLVGLVLSLWLFFSLALMKVTPWMSGVATFLASLLIHWILEARFWRREAAEPEEKKSGAWLVIPLLLSLVSGGFIVAAKKLHALTATDLHWAVFLPALAWVFTPVVLSVGRLVLNRRRHRAGPLKLYYALALDRGIARCLLAASIWGTLGALWILSTMLGEKLHAREVSSVGISGGTAALLAGLFTMLRDWLAKPIQPTNLQTVIQRLKPMLPQLLAYAAVAFLVVFVFQLVVMSAAVPTVPTMFWFAVLCLLILGLTLVIFDQSSVGLHEFYRGRIARCFLGAANSDAANKTASHNRQTNERRNDDLNFDDLPARTREGSEKEFASIRLRPIHLVCCAANNLAGDPLSSLYRGARSAVLSQRGITLGNETAELPDLRFSSALTASAAAFNSNMGSISMGLGWPAAFLMTALNLRLGLWVPHPRNPKRHQSSFPGQFFFFEMFGRTRCDSMRLSSNRLHLHLSDGGHFENLGLYELIRRHCRYIIVSDCGADPHYTFDDLGNAIRRVREDFGVEIELDLDPLKAGVNGLSRQHAVAGVIHYDGITGYDKGTILCFKPTLTGNEPRDVLQYKNRNAVFPQESTGDQFYDEAQWESYHRLGEHSGHECFRFIEDLPQEQRYTAESIFHFAYEQWQPGWADQNEHFLALTSRFAKMESQMRESAPAFLRAEFFPEVAVGQNFAPRTHDDEIRTVYLLMQAMQVMEDAWLACRLDTSWSHPLNGGWMSYVHRWVATPSFRRWWPILMPIFSQGFRNFIRNRFGLTFKDAQKGQPTDTKFRVAKVDDSQAEQGFAWQQWRRERTFSLPEISKRIILQFEVVFPTYVGSPDIPPLQVGILVAERDDKKIRWPTTRFFVPAALDGAGFVRQFLDAAVEHFKSEESIKELQVTIVDTNPENAQPHRDAASRARRQAIVDFYSSRGFRHSRTPNAANDLDQMIRCLKEPLETS